MARAGSRATSMKAALPGLRRVLQSLWPFMRKHRPMMFGATLALIGATMMKLLEPWPLKFIIDRVVPASLAGTGSSGIAVIDALDPMTLLAICSGAVVVVIGVGAFLQYVSTVGFALVGSKVLTEVRGTLFRHLQALSLGFHSKSKTGDLTMRLISDVGMLKETAVTAALPLAANVLVLAGMISVMFFVDWQLTLIALLPLPFLWFGSSRMGKKIQEVSRKQRKLEGDMAATASEAIAGMRTVKVLAIEERSASRFAGANARSDKDGVKAKRLAAGLERMVDLLVAVATALVLYFGAVQVIRGRMTPGDLIVFITYLKATFRPVRGYAKYTARIAKATAAGERVVELLDEAPEVRDAPDARPAPNFRGDVVFDNVTFGYDAGVTALNGVSFDVAAGTRVAITGPSGAGKSTLSGLILRLYDPASGRVLIDGEDIRELTMASLRSQISLVPQDTLLFRGTMADNIALAAGREVTEAEIEEAARIANAHDFISALPRGYETEVAERGATLSNGQRQRIAIARAVLRRSPILVLDEPTVGLDGANEAAVNEAIWRLAQGKTSFLITHDVELAARADRILYVEGGEIVEDGSHAELLAADGRYARLWRLQTGAGETEAVHAVAG